MHGGSSPFARTMEAVNNCFFLLRQIKRHKIYFYCSEISCDIYNDFPGISNDCNGFTTSEIAQMVHFPRHGDKRSAARDERMRRPGAAGDRGKLE